MSSIQSPTFAVMLQLWGRDYDLQRCDNQFWPLSSVLKPKTPSLLMGLRVRLKAIKRLLGVLFYTASADAETEGFEPSVELLTPHSISNRAPSATRSRLQKYTARKNKKSEEAKGFEPLVGMNLRRFSKPLPSTARPRLQDLHHIC